MTLNEIRDDVAALGFESEIALDGAFAAAVRRALSTLYTERGSHAQLRLYQNMPKPAVYVEQLEHSGGGTENIGLPCQSYAFEVFGSGRYTIVDADGVRTDFFEGTRNLISGRCAADAEIIFEGEFRYTVRHLSGFREIFSDGSIPLYSTVQEYDLYAFSDDILSVFGTAKDSAGRDIAGASICSGILKLPYSYVGEMNVTYRKRPPLVYTDTPDAELGIDPECSHLVALLTAAYIWLDDDPDKAQYYMSLYRDGMAAVKMYGGGCADSGYKDVTGWA